MKFKKKTENKKGPQALFLPQEIRVYISDEENILDLALKNGIEIDHSCEGMGSCTTCRVFVEGPIDLLNPRNEIEAERAEERGFQNNERLACQTKPIKDLIIKIP